MMLKKVVLILDLQNVYMSPVLKVYKKAECLKKKIRFLYKNYQIKTKSRNHKYFIRQMNICKKWRSFSFVLYMFWKRPTSVLQPHQLYVRRCLYVPSGKHILLGKQSPSGCQTFTGPLFRENPMEQALFGENTQNT